LNINNSIFLIIFYRLKDSSTKTKTDGESIKGKEREQRCSYTLLEEGISVLFRIYTKRMGEGNKQKLRVKNSLHATSSKKSLELSGEVVGEAIYSALNLSMSIGAKSSSTIHF
jgi:hypothetical protein